MLIAENEVGSIRYTAGASLGLDLGPWFVLRVGRDSVAFKGMDLPLVEELLEAAIDVVIDGTLVQEG